MTGFTAVNEAFRLARKQNDTLREAIRGSSRETIPERLRLVSEAMGTFPLLDDASDEIKRLTDAIAQADSLYAALQEPTEAMLIAARDCSAKYGKPIGNVLARACWVAMLQAAKETDDAKS